MGFADYVVIAILLIAVIAAVFHMRKQKKAGKCIGCSGGNCDACMKYRANSGK